MRATRFRCGPLVFPVGLIAEAGVLAIARLLPQVAGAAVSGTGRAGSGRYAADHQRTRRRQYAPFSLIEPVLWGLSGTRCGLDFPSVMELDGANWSNLIVPQI
jgi:hypothetical protein